MSEKITISIAQISCKVGDKEFNLRKIEKSISHSKKLGANLIIFPELALTGYLCRDLIYDLAEPIPRGPSTKQIAQKAEEEDIHVVFGMIESSESAESVIYNTAVLVGPNGFIGKYQKINLPTHSVFEEKRYFRPGNKAQVFKTNIGRLGLAICYDIFFPEIARILKLKGAQIVICISASPSTRRTFFEALTVARAIENNVFVTFANLVGIEDGLQFWGGSRIISPTGGIITQAKYDYEDFVIAEIEYSDIKRAEIFVPTIRDLRLELASKLKEETENFL